MTEWRQRNRIGPTELLPRSKIRFEADQSQSDNDFYFFQSLQFIEQVGPAVDELRWQGFVVGGSAVNCRRDVGIDKLESIPALNGNGLVREAEIVERAVKPIAGPVTCENSSGAITPVGGWRQANDQEPRSSAAEARNGPSPIFPIAEPPNLVARYLFAILDQSRAAPAIDDFTLGRPLAHSE